MPEESVLDKMFGVIYQMIDNETLIIVSVSILAYLSPDHRELIAGGLIGYLGTKIKSHT